MQIARFDLTSLALFDDGDRPWCGSIATTRDLTLAPSVGCSGTTPAHTVDRELMKTLVERLRKISRLPLNLSQRLGIGARQLSDQLTPFQG